MQQTRADQTVWKKQVGPKKAREMWFMTRFYTASEADKMGLINTVVPVKLIV